MEAGHGLAGQVVNEALDYGTIVVGGLCFLFYLLLGVGSLMTDLSEKRRVQRLYGPRENQEQEEE